ncbi:unnamed protein product [Ixodes persulcatus]
MAGQAAWSVHRLLVSACIFFAFTSAEPSCQETTPIYYMHPEYTCSNLSSPDELLQHMPKNMNSSRIEVVLKDSRLNHFPPGAFAGNKVTSLVLNNVTVKTFALPGASGSVFDELQDTLEKLVFYKNSSLPETWSMLKNVKHLEELVFFRISRLRLGDDFNDLPTSMKNVAVVQSSLTEVGSGWMSSLQKLEKVRIENSDFKVFSRAMLPRPAESLRELVITRTPITSLPSDFSEGFPALSMLNLRLNKITTFEEAALAPLKKTGATVVLTGNSLHCDCKLAFLLAYPDGWHYPKCETPDVLAKTPFKGLDAGKLGCGDVVAGSEKPE